MKANRRDILKSSSGVAVATLFSRILGLFRSMLEAWVLGDGVLASAWQLSFMTPNLFRRLFGEGALAQALIPLISHSESETDDLTVRRRLGVVFAVLGVILSLTVILVSGGALVARFFVESENAKLVTHLLPLIMPYCFFICLVGIIGAILNTKRIFFLPALSALLMNVFLIVSLYFAPRLFGDDKLDLLDSLAYSVLASGLIQFVLMLVLLRRCNRLPRFDRESLKEIGVLKELWHLMLPGFLSASAVQISFVIDQNIACWIGPGAVAALNYADRIVYVPLGVFATALSAVLLADMSRAAARGDFNEMLDDLALGMRYVFFLCLPAAVFIMVFREEILRLLYMRGNFTESGVQATGFAILFYALGIPTFCMTKMILPAFYARKDMRTPLKMSLIAIGCNIVLNLLLMVPLRQGGIALATVFSSLINNGLLLFALSRCGFRVEYFPVLKAFLKTSASCLLAVCVWFAYDEFEQYFSVSFLPPDLLPLLVSGSIFTLVFLLLSWIFRSEELPELLGVFGKLKK